MMLDDDAIAMHLIHTTASSGAPIAADPWAVHACYIALQKQTHHSRHLHALRIMTSNIEAAPRPAAAIVTTPQLWGFFHTTCIYESAAGLVSLHRTKAGAWRAMRQAQWDAWEELRSTENTHLHLDRDSRRWMRCDKAYVHEKSHVRAVEVLP